MDEVGNNRDLNPMIHWTVMASEADVRDNERGFVVEEPRRTPVWGVYDVIVLGGGPAGVSAALAAAERGCRVALVERYGFLGGMATAASVSNFCGLHANVGGEIKQVVHGFADRLIAALRARDALAAPHSVLGKTYAMAYDSAVYRCVLDELLVGAGVDLHFHALAVGCAMRDGRIHGLFIETKSGRGFLEGSTFVDGSGDADLAKWAGVPTANGFDNGYLAFPTLMFRVGNVDGPRAKSEGKPQMRAKMAAYSERTGVRFPRIAAYVNPQPHDNEWRVNATQISWNGGPLDASQHEHYRYAEPEGRRQVLAFFDFLKSDVPGFEKAYLLDIAAQIGVRETRRIVGSYVLSGEDVLRCRRFPDSIGVNGWPVEKHVRGDVEWQWLDDAGFHQIPYRAILPVGAVNLLVAGRCASTTQDGQASLRVSGPCYQMGEAAGVACALSVQTGASLSEIDVKVLQSALVDRGANLG